MRAQEEIVARINAAKEEDIFGFESSDLVDALDFEHAKPFLKEEATAEGWEKRKEEIDSTTDEGVRKQISEYLTFAFDKALGHRGISASRSVSHFRAWCWLLGDDELVSFIDDDNYAQYGMPVLVAVAKKYAPEKIPDDPAVMRMAEGLPCTEHCDEGCGR